MERTPTPPEALADIIRELRDGELAQGYHQYALSTGLCSDFASDMERAAHEQGIPVDGLDILSFCRPGEDGYADEALGLDMDLLARHWPASKLPSFPPHVQPPDLVKELADTYHAWVVLDGRHYDADAPEGVDNMFDLPMYRRVIVEYAGFDEVDESWGEWWAESRAIAEDFRKWAHAGRPGSVADVAARASAAMRP